MLLGQLLRLNPEPSTLGKTKLETPGMVGGNRGCGPRKHPKSSFGQRFALARTCHIVGSVFEKSPRRSTISAAGANGFQGSLNLQVLVYRQCKKPFNDL